MQESLFPAQQRSNLKNLLPQDGELLYYGVLFSKAEADEYFGELLNKIEWKHDEAIMFGKHIFTKRKVAWYAEMPFAYHYSKVTKTALPFTKTLLKLKEKIEAASGHSYNSCLMNLYHTGEEGMAWHSDAEKELQKNGAIASVSFGAERNFAFKHKVSGQTISIMLQHGSLLVMKGSTQTHWLHRLPPTKKIVSPRINLTFRTINLPAK